MESMLYIGLALLAASVLLLVAEAFIPSGGLIALVSIGCALAGVVMLFRYDTMWGVIGLLSVLILGPMAFFGAMSMLPATPFGQRLIGGTTEAEQQAIAEAERAHAEARAALLGAEGETITACRPVGEALIEGERYEVKAEGGILEAGTRVRVTAAGRREISVRALG